MDIFLIGCTVRHELERLDAILEKPYLQLARHGTVSTFGFEPYGYGIAFHESSAVQMQRRRFCQLLFYRGSPFGIIDRTMPVDQSDRLVFEVPMVVVFVARFCNKPFDSGIARKAKRPSMNADSHQRVAIRLLQLPYDLRRFGTIRTSLPRKVLQEHDTPGWFRLLVNQSVGL